MEFVLHNWIADMPGSLFIGMALVYAVAVVIGVKTWVDSADSTRELPVPSLHSLTDPYEIAYLRGDERELGVTALFNLMQQGYLKSDDAGNVGHGDKAPGHLNALEQAVYSQFATPQSVNKVLFSKEVQVRLMASGTDYKQQLTRKGMLTHQSSRQMGWFQALLGIVLLEMPLLYKMMVAVLKGKSNIGFLMMLLFFGPVVLFAVCRPGRLTSLGRRTLNQFKEEWTDKEPTLAGSSAQGEAAMMVALFGVGILAGTSYGYFKDFFPRATGGGTSCSTCSSGSSCGSSCGGGGCGGCGGD